MPYNSAPTFTSDPDFFVPLDDYDTIRRLAGVDEDEWPDPRLQDHPFLPIALAEARLRVPCDWEPFDANLHPEGLDLDSRHWLRLALVYHTAALIVPAANPGRTEDFRIGPLSLKTDDADLLADPRELMGDANAYYASVKLPVGIVPIRKADAFARPTIRASSVCNVGPGRLY